jgi:hypothetical protein
MPSRSMGTQPRTTPAVFLRIGSVTSASPLSLICPITLRRTPQDRADVAVGGAAQYRTTRSPGWRRRTACRHWPRRSRPDIMQQRCARAALPSSVLEFCRPFFEEGGDAFLEIFRRASDPLRFEFEIELILERIAGAFPIEFSDPRQRDSRAVCKLMRELHGLPSRPRVVMDAIDEPTFQRFSRRESLAHQ